MSRLEDPNWSQKMTDRVLKSQIANQEESSNHSQFQKFSLMKTAVAILVLFGLGIGIFQVGINFNEKTPDNLASIDTAMLGDIYWEKDEWDEEIFIFRIYE
jgi:hypothetical protein